MWRGELRVAFRKGEHFLNACEAVGVPADCLDEANDIWTRLCLSEYAEEIQARERYARAA